VRPDIQHNDTQHNDTQHNGGVVLLRVIYAKCYLYAECHVLAFYAQCRYAECRYAECLEA
jgi:hypothetical protein